MNCFRFLGNTRDLKIKQCLLNVDAAVYNVLDECLEEVKAQFNVFSTLPEIVVDGTVLMQKEIFGVEYAPSEILKPNFSYKLYKGKTLNEMESW
jgi:hypothetical protein